jgi:hypothetical protein
MRADPAGRRRALQPLTLLAGGGDQIELSLVERAHGLLRQEVNGHPQAGERRPELVGHGGHQVVLQLVEAAEPGDVLEHHRHPQEPALVAGDGAGPGKEGPVPVGGLHHQRLLETPGLDRRCPGQHLAADALHPLPDLRWGGGDGLFPGPHAEQPRRRPVGVGQPPAGVEHQHRVGEAVDGGLGRRLRLEQLAEAALPVAL